MNGEALGPLVALALWSASSVGTLAAACVKETPGLSGPVPAKFSPHAVSTCAPSARVTTRDHLPVASLMVFATSVPSEKTWLVVSGSAVPTTRVDPVETMLVVGEVIAGAFGTPATAAAARS